MFLRSYTPDGVVRWTDQFGTNGYDWGKDVVVDSQGSIAVTGSVGGALPGQIHRGNYDGFVRVYEPTQAPADVTPPTVDVASPADGAVVALNAAVDAEYGCADDTDPSPSCVGTVPDGAAIDTSSVGQQLFTVIATDAAGNETVVTHTYTVAYEFDGFADPVDPDRANTATAGQAVPLKFRVSDALGSPITGLSEVTVTARALACPLGSSPDQSEERATGHSGLQNLGEGYYQFNWKTPESYKHSCKTMALDLGDGVPHPALFRFTN